MGVRLAFVIQQRIEDKLKTALDPSHLEVINESHMHSVAPGSETHFKVVVVSSKFEGLSPVKRHQLVYGVLQEQLRKKPKGIHALAITSRTPSEWSASPIANESPECESKKRG